MPSSSPSVTLAWKIAAMETTQAGFQYIEREQIVIGVLKVGDLLDPEVRAGAKWEASRADLEALEKELLPIEKLLSDFGLSRVELRRLIRGGVGQGNCVHNESMVHRSERCKRYFQRADEIARGRHALTMRPLHLLEAILEEPGEIITQVLAGSGIEAGALREAASKLEEKELETVGATTRDEKGEKKSTTPFLDRYGIDLTRLARDGKIEPMIGRREELLQMVRTLTRKTKNNPLLIGEAGVGKTAIVKGLALRIAQGNITPGLQNKRLIELNIAGLVAGTKYRGEFEERVLRILEEVKKSKDVLLFMDEIHTIMGAGRAEGAPMDAANIMKPALAAGEISCIGATTLAEYRRHIEKDAALERRFQPIMVEEPTPEETLAILKGLKEHYEVHHQVMIRPDALEAAVTLSVRYLADRRLPDKALDIIDEACSRVEVTSLSFYGQVEDVRATTGEVTEAIVAKVVADWSGRPVERPGKEEQERLSGMEGELKRRVIGQDEAVEKVAQIIKMARAALRDPRRPTGVFLFLGPTGVGKTELARALTQFLFGSEDQMIRLDMSEYMEKHSVAKLIGSPPGYVGYEEEGQLTGKLRCRPYTVVLLDEIEKAHPEVLDIFLQLFDEGRLTDAKGRTVDAKNAIFIMTSNIGGEQYQKGPVGFGAQGEKDKNHEVVTQLKGRMRPELLNRMDEVIIFRSLEPAEVTRIVALMLESLKERLETQGIRMEVTREAVILLAETGYDPLYGARPLARAIDQLVSKPLSEMIIKGAIQRGEHVSVSVKAKQLTFTIGGRAE